MEYVQIDGTLGRGYIHPSDEFLRGGAWDEYLAEPYAHHGDERQRPGFFDHL